MPPETSKFEKVFVSEKVQVKEGYKVIDLAFNFILSCYQYFCEIKYMRVSITISKKQTY